MWETFFTAILVIIILYFINLDQNYQDNPYITIDYGHGQLPLFMDGLAEQNVHDREIAGAFTKKEERLYELVNTEFPNIEELIATNVAANMVRRYYIHNNNIKALSVLDKIDKTTAIYIFYRSNSRVNVANSKNIKDALALALEDCMERGHLVCRTGIKNKLMGSLTLLDPDPVLGESKVDVSTYLDDARQETSKLLKQAVDNMTPELRDKYMSGESDADVNAALEAVESAIKLYINNFPIEKISKVYILGDVVKGIE